MISLDHISLVNFRTFYGEHEIILPERGIVQVRGASGAGKSNIFEAIAYALGYSTYTKDQVKSWGEDLEPKVSLDFTIDGKGFQVIRHDRLRVFDDEQVVKGQAKDLAAYIESKFKIPLNLFGLLTYRPQQGLEAFIRKPDKEKKEFLTELLGLQRFEDQVETAKKRIKDELEPAMVSISMTLENLKNNHQYLADEMAAITIPDVKPLQEEFNALKARRVSELEKKAEWERKANIKMKELVIPQQVDSKHAAKLMTQIDELTQSDSRRRFAVDDVRAKLAGNLARAEAQIKNEDKIKENVGRLEREIQAIKEDKCPTCEQDWIQDVAGIDQKREKVAALCQELAQINSNRAAIPQFKRSLEEHHWFPDPEIKNLQDQLKARREADRLDYQEVITGVEAKREKVVAAFERACSKFMTVEEQNRILNVGLTIADIQRRQDKYDILEGQRAKVGDELIKQDSALADATHQILVEKDFIKLTGREGFLGLIFDEILQEITNEANQILSQVPNTNNISVCFQSENQLLKGTTQRAIKLEVTINGHATTWERGCSGGQRTIVALAIDLALQRVISRRTNTNPGFLILDEPFEGADTISRMACLDMLQTFAQDKLILVVDHDLINAENFTKTIAVININGRSRIE